MCRRDRTRQVACITIGFLYHILTETFHLAASAPTTPFSWLAYDAKLQDELATLADNRLLFVTQTSCAYLEFSQNWIHHLKALQINNWLVVTSDDIAYSWLSSTHPGHILQVARFQNLLPDNDTDPAGISTKFASFGSANFAQLSCVRPVILAGILHAGLRSMWSDADSVYLTDPRSIVPDLYEYVGADDNHTGNEQNTTRLCTGFSFFRPTVAVSDLLLEWHLDCMQGLKTTSTRHDQNSFNAVMQARKRSLLDFYILPRIVAPNGDLSRKLRVDTDAKPLWVHANWVVGRKAKLSRLRGKGFWHSEGKFPKC